MTTPSADRPWLTVAVPTYNGAPRLAETLRSILDQTDAAFDLIVHDDRSTDDTREIVAAVAGGRARFVENESRLGLAGNWNACVESARTEWVAIVHQDDLLRPGHLAAHGELARREPSLGFVASAAGVVDRDGRPIEGGIEPGGLGGVGRVFAVGELIPHLTVANPLRCSAATLRREAHRAVGGFDPTYRYVVDWDFWIRVAERFPVGWLGRTTVDFRWHAASETHTFKTGLADLEETERLLSRFPPSAAARRRLARAYLNRAYDAAKAGSRGLEARALLRALRSSPAILARLVVDPRLTARLALGAAFSWSASEC